MFPRLPQTALGKEVNTLAVREEEFCKVSGSETKPRGSKAGGGI